MNTTQDATLEQALSEAAAGRIPMEQLLDTLMEAQVFIPIRDAVGINGNQGIPLVLTAEDGTEVIILFSAPDKAKGFLADIPGYEGGLVAEFTWVLERIDGDYGVSINPDAETGLDLEPAQVATLRARGAASDTPS